MPTAIISPITSAVAEKSPIWRLSSFCGVAFVKTVSICALPFVLVYYKLTVCKNNKNFQHGENGANRD